MVSMASATVPLSTGRPSGRVMAAVIPLRVAFASATRAGSLKSSLKVMGTTKRRIASVTRAVSPAATATMLSAAKR